MELSENTDKIQAAMKAVLAGKELHVAAREAGYSTPSRDLYPRLADQATRRYVRSNMLGRLECEGAPAAYNLMMLVMRDDKADKKLRIEIAKFLYAAAGYTPPKAGEALRDDANEKPPEEMTNEELRQFIEKGEAELANRATPIQPTETLNL